MATLHLPENPDLDQLRTQARDLQRRVRSGAPLAEFAGVPEVGGEGPAFPLNRAQLALARGYGFASWVRLRRHVEAIRARSWTYRDGPGDESSADRLVRLACLTYSATDDDPSRLERARTMLAADPGLASSSLPVAVVAGDLAAARAQVTAEPASATAPSGPHGWSPLMYLAYGRLDLAGSDPLGVARLLLDAGADPDDGRFFAGLATPFTVLTGLLGGGEHDAPPHPQALSSARLLLEHGAEANDAQALYNLQFGSDDSALELLFEFGLGRGDGGPWRRLLPDLLVSPRRLLRRLLRWAVEHDQRARVELLAAHGVDVRSPLGAATPLELALRNGHVDLAADLRALGADEPELGADEAFVAAALAGDRVRAGTAPRDVVDRVRARRPGLVVWAAGLGRRDAVAVLLDLGWDVNASGRGDVPRDEPWQTALHSAVEADDADTVTLLLARGADLGLRDARFGSTPLQWARHLGRDSIVALLE